LQEGSEITTDDEPEIFEWFENFTGFQPLCMWKGNEADAMGHGADDTLGYGTQVVMVGPLQTEEIFRLPSGTTEFLL